MQILRSVQNVIIFYADIAVHIGTSVRVPLGSNLLMNTHYKFLKGENKCSTVVLEYFNYLSNLVKNVYLYFIKALVSVLKSIIVVTKNHNTS